MGYQEWTPLQEEAIRLDKMLYAKYYPDDEIGNVNVKPTWLHADVEGLLATAEDIDKKMDEILKFIKEQSPKHADAVIAEFLDIEKLKKSARIRQDFKAALSNMSARDIAYAIGCGFSNKDICELAKLHKSGQFREKIEDLLTDCNFHQECNAFINGKYDEFNRYT